MRRVLLVLSAVVFAWAGVVLVTGGVHWRLAGMLFRSRDPGRALALALALLVTHAMCFRDAFTRDTDRVAALLRRTAPLAAGVCAAVLAVHALHFGTFTAGGSDSYGYLSQAYGWARGALPRAEKIPIAVPWPSSDAALAPLGYRPGPEPHTIVPTYAPGLPLMMAVATAPGPCGPFLVVPLCAALLVWSTFQMGRRMAGAGAGLLAAVVIVTVPIVLFQSMWPMSDIPAAAFWTMAAVSVLTRTSRAALASGAWTAAGLLVRPNLPFLPLVLLAQIAATERRAAAIWGTLAND